jgi:ATP-dependent DNA helicase RecG
LPKREALEKIHLPKSLEEFEQARRTLAFEEFFVFQIGAALERQRASRKSAPALALSDEALEEFLAALPFKLTRAQERALEEIRRDLASGHPMNRLLQGDVGSGKTVVAAAAAYIAAKAGAQTALMAPTEILAQQHHDRLAPLLEPLGVRVALLIGSLPPSEKGAIQRAIASGEVELVLGTHALISEGVNFAKLGLVIIDEQHRFGVIQRAQLEEKGSCPHVLVMSATPIPRTITLILYGQFEVSIIDELPFPKEIRTYWVSEEVRGEVYRLVAQELKRGAQAYVVYPLIEESEELDLRAAAQMKEELEGTFFKDFRVGLLHGRMSEDEKRAVMEKIHQKELDVLVSTTIIEVGIDVPDASIMVIEHAERFGLSQLHQLRGRIGRKGQRALCFAIATAKTEEARRRLEAFRDLSDGFEIAEEDLKIRGPGELLGVSQHGLDTTFKVADLIRDLPIMKAARDEAFRLIEREPDTPLIREFERRFGERFELARV